MYTISTQNSTKRWSKSILSSWSLKLLLFKVLVVLYLHFYFFMESKILNFKISRLLTLVQRLEIRPFSLVNMFIINSLIEKFMHLKKTPKDSTFLIEQFKDSTVKKISTLLMETFYKQNQKIHNSVKSNLSYLIPAVQVQECYQIIWEIWMKIRQIWMEWHFNNFVNTNTLI